MYMPLKCTDQAFDIIFLGMLTRHLSRLSQAFLEFPRGSKVSQDHLELFQGPILTPGTQRPAEARLHQNLDP